MSSTESASPALMHQSLSNAWRHRKFFMIPVQAIYEPNYESGKAVRLRIEREDSQPIGLAGQWEFRDGKDALNRRTW